jgi:hypothetical protein
VLRRRRARLPRAPARGVHPTGVPPMEASERDVTIQRGVSSGRNCLLWRFTHLWNHRTCEEKGGLFSNNNCKSYYFQQDHHIIITTVAKAESVYHCR